MKNYELVCIFDPQVGEGQFEQAVERYKAYITDNGGEIVNVDLWVCAAWPTRRKVSKTAVRVITSSISLPPSRHLSSRWSSL